MGPTRQTRNRRAARTEFALVAIDDHSRLPYVEIHRHDRSETAAGVLQGRRLDARTGCGPIQAVMTNNAMPTGAAARSLPPPTARAQHTS